MCLGLPPSLLQKVTTGKKLFTAYKDVPEIFNDAGIDFKEFVKQTGFRREALSQWKNGNSLAFDAVFLGYPLWLKAAKPDDLFETFKQMLGSFGFTRLTFNAFFGYEGNYNVFDQMFKRKPHQALIVVLGVIELRKKQVRGVV